MSNTKILIVEDNVLEARYLSNYLQSNGYKNSITTSGEEAIKLSREIQPDLVLMDILLSGKIDGIEAADHIRENNHIPVIFLTAHTEKELIRRAKTIEPFGFIVKPYNLRELDVCIEMALYKIQVENARKAAEEELLKVRKIESIATLAGGMAHDYNNLLTAIIGNLTLANEFLQADDRSVKYIKEAEKAAFKTRDLTRKLMTLANVDESRPSVKTKPVQMSAFLNRIKMSNPAGITYKFKIEQHLGTCDINELQIDQILKIILTNAQEAMDDGGVIKINAVIDSLDELNSYGLTKGEYVKISICDEGIGMPDDMVEKIFDPYFSTKKKCTQKGMGLGLTLAYTTIRQHNGCLSVKSEFEKGTIFNIYLPLLPTAEAIPDNQYILVMDDEKMVRDIAVGILEHIGHKAISASDGVEALNIYRAEKNAGRSFDLVILDLSVTKGMGGRETLEELLSIDPEVKAIISSGYTNDAVIKNYNDYGFVGVIVKPYEISELMHVLNKGKI